MSDGSTPAQALWFAALRTAVLRQEDVPDPAPGEIQVRAIHSMVSAGSELNLYRGEGNLPDLLLPTARGTLPFPVKFAYQLVGEVVAAGEGSGYAPGEKVLAPHPHQDLFDIPAAMVARLPQGLDTLRAQFAPLFRVGLQMMLQRPVRPGEVVAVSGLGVVGLLAAFLARLSAGRLILIDPLPLRREKARWIGADAVVAPDEAAAAIAALSDGRGVDMFAETSGAPAALQAAIVNTAPLGVIAVAAWYGTKAVQLSLSPEFHLRSLKIISIHVSNLDEDNRWNEQRMMSTAFDFLRRIDVDALVTHRFPFRRAADAYALLDQRPEQALAVLLDYQTG